jgi:hypothetical protein
MNIYETFFFPVFFVNLAGKRKHSPEILVRVLLKHMFHCYTDKCLHTTVGVGQARVEIGLNTDYIGQHCLIFFSSANARSFYIKVQNKMKKQIIFNFVFL